MDTTPKYIEMCKKTTEIQGQWQPQEGDYVSVNYSKWKGGHYETVLKEGLRDSLIVSRNWEEDDFLDRDISIFLPRQDQLQDMYSTDLFTLLHDFDEWIEFHTDGTDKYESMEQLWLSFIMLEKFSKVWSAERKEWEKA